MSSSEVLEFGGELLRWVASPMALFFLLVLVVSLLIRGARGCRLMALLTLCLALVATPFLGKLTMKAMENLCVQTPLSGDEGPVYLVLAGGAWRDGDSWEPSSATIRRMRRATSALVEKEGLLLLSGIESSLMVGWLEERSIVAPLLREKTSRTTEENLRFSADLIRREGLTERSIAIVTDRFHMRRSLLWARHWMPDAKLLPLPASSIVSPLRLPWDLLPSLKGLEYTSLAWREVIALARDWFIISWREYKNKKA